MITSGPLTTNGSDLPIQLLSTTAGQFTRLRIAVGNGAAFQYSTSGPNGPYASIPAASSGSTVVTDPVNLSGLSVWLRRIPSSGNDATGIYASAW